MLSVLFNKLVLKNKHNLNMLFVKTKATILEKLMTRKSFIHSIKTSYFFNFGLIKFLKENKSNVLFTSMTHTNVAAIIIKILFL